LFAELKSHDVTARINGKIAIELATAKMPQLATALQSSIAFLIFLKRCASGAPSLRPFSKARASAILEQVICYGEQQVRDAQKSALRDLLCAGILELQYSDLDSAVSCLEGLVRCGIPDSHKE
jgi:hypothetical protein